MSSFFKEKEVQNSAHVSDEDVKLDPTMRRCVFDAKLTVTPDTPAVALLRKPEGKQPEHAFMVVQMMPRNAVTCFRRYDLFAGNGGNFHPGSVNIKEVETRSDQTGIAAVYQQKILKNDPVYQLAWSFSPEEADRLHQNVENAKIDPPKYIVCSNQSIFSSFQHSGDNCFTWARKQLTNLGNVRICSDLEKQNLKDLLAPLTSNYVTSPKEPVQNNNKIGCHIL